SPNATLRSTVSSAYPLDKSSLEYPTISDNLDRSILPTPQNIHIEPTVSKSVNGGCVFGNLCHSAEYKSVIPPLTPMHAADMSIFHSPCTTHQFPSLLPPLISHMKYSPCGTFLALLHPGRAV